MANNPAPAIVQPPARSARYLKIQADDQVVVKISREPVLAIESTFPSVFFTAAGIKPTIHLRMNAELTVDALRVYVGRYLGGEGVPIDYVALYLHSIFGQISGTLTETWETYGNRFSDQITPRSFYNLTPLGALAPYSLQEQFIATNEDDIYLVVAVASMFRYGKTHVTAQAAYLTRWNALLTNIFHSFPDINFTNTTHSGRLSENESITKLLSALDMFLSRFPDHDYAKARFGTIILRHMGCSGIGSLKWLSRLVGKDQICEGYYWVFASSAIREIDTMFSVDEEVDITHSYFPYALGFGIIKKSPYSTADNINCHWLTHIVGTLYLKARSYHALNVDSGPSPDVAFNAVMIYLSTKRSMDLQVGFIPESQAEAYAARVNAQADAQQRDIAAATLPTTPLDWFYHYEEQRRILTPMQRQEVREALQALNRLSLREGSIGRWVNDSLLSILPISAADASNESANQLEE